MDLKFDWKSLVRQVAPAIASTFGGPLAGMGVSALSTALLGKPDGTEADVAVALATATPDTLLKIKQADQQFAVDMKKLDIDFEKIAADDRASARQREVAVKDNTPRVLAYVYTAGYFAMIAFLFKYGVPDANTDLINILVGILSTVQVAIITYYFGSSHGSAAKTALMAGLEKRK